MSSIVDCDGERKNISNQVRAFAKDFNFKIKLCKPRHLFTKGKVEATNKFLTWLLHYEGKFETEDELIAILEKINPKVNAYPCQETNMPPLVLFEKEKEYLQRLPSDDIVESYIPHERQTTVRSDSLVTYQSCQYSVPSKYIGKPVRLLVSDDTLHIYFSMDLITVHVLSTKRLNYQKDHYQQLLTQTMKDADMITKLAEANLK